MCIFRKHQSKILHMFNVAGYNRSVWKWDGNGGIQSCEKQRQRAAPGQFTRPQFPIGINGRGLRYHGPQRPLVLSKMAWMWWWGGMICVDMKSILPDRGILIIKIRWSWDCLIFMMGVSKYGKIFLLLKWSPGVDYIVQISQLLCTTWWPKTRTSWWHYTSCVMSPWCGVFSHQVVHM